MQIRSFPVPDPVLDELLRVQLEALEEIKRAFLLEAEPFRKRIAEIEACRQTRYVLMPD